MWELAKRWNKLPWEIKQMPTHEYYSLLEMHRLEAFTEGRLDG